MRTRRGTPGTLPSGIRDHRGQAASDSSRTRIAPARASIPSPLTLARKARRFPAIHAAPGVSFDPHPLRRPCRPVAIAGAPSPYPTSLRSRVSAANDARLDRACVVTRLRAKRAARVARALSQVAIGNDPVAVLSRSIPAPVARSDAIRGRYRVAHYLVPSECVVADRCCHRLILPRRRPCRPAASGVSILPAVWQHVNRVIHQDIHNRKLAICLFYWPAPRSRDIASPRLTTTISAP